MVFVNVFEKLGLMLWQNAIPPRPHDTDRIGLVAGDEGSFGFKEAVGFGEGVGRGLEGGWRLLLSR